MYVIIVVLLVLCILCTMDLESEIKDIIIIIIIKCTLWGSCSFTRCGCNMCNAMYRGLSANSQGMLPRMNK